MGELMCPFLNSLLAAVSGTWQSVEIVLEVKEVGWRQEMLLVPKDHITEGELK